MDIMELGAIGELVGGVAVIGSLIFVGIQLRSTTRTLRTTATYEALRDNLDVHNPLFADPTFASLVAAIEDGETPVDVDRATNAKLRFLARSAMFHVAGQQLLHRHGIFDDDAWEQQVAWARAFVRSPAGSAWWAHDRDIAAYPREFVNLLDREV